MQLRETKQLNLTVLSHESAIRLSSAPQQSQEQPVGNSPSYAVCNVKQNQLTAT
jgi:hypothetical protein